MATFTLGTSTLAGDGDAVRSVEVTGEGRWTQFEVTHTETKEITFLGFYIYYALSSERFEAGN